MQIWVFVCDSNDQVVVVRDSGGLGIRHVLVRGHDSFHHQMQKALNDKELEAHVRESVLGVIRSDCTCN